MHQKMLIAWICCLSADCRSLPRSQRTWLGTSRPADLGVISYGKSRKTNTTSVRALTPIIQADVQPRVDDNPESGAFGGAWANHFSRRLRAGSELHRPGDAHRPRTTCSRPGDFDFRDHLMPVALPDPSAHPVTSDAPVGKLGLFNYTLYDSIAPTCPRPQPPQRRCIHLGIWGWVCSEDHPLLVIRPVTPLSTAW